MDTLPTMNFKITKLKAEVQNALSQPSDISEMTFLFTTCLYFKIV